MTNPDLIVYNGRIYLQPDRKSRVEAISITDGRVTNTGSSRELLRLKSTSVDTIDLHGLVALPGFADSHIHLLGYGMLMRTLNLAGARSILEIQRMLAKAASTKLKDQWILGRGWDQEKLREHRYPDRFDLDAVGNPTFLRRICGHVAVANSAALTATGVNENTPEPFGGEIDRDSTGKPSGILKERALEIVSRSIPRDEKETREALLVASEKLLALGVTSLHCIVEDEQEFKALKVLKKEGKIAQTIYAILPLSMLDQVRSMKDELRMWADGFRVGGTKIFLDGSLGARTAALKDPYDDLGSCGMLTTSKEELLHLIEKTRETGLQLCLHAIGDKAVQLGIETLNEALGPRDCQKSRHRIEHASLLSSNLIKDMASLGLVGSIQPRFIYSDSWAEQRLGTSRVEYLYPFKSMLRAGIHLAAGSDTPSDDPSPAEGLWSAVARPGLSPAERLTVNEALSCYTTGAAYASFSENNEGSLEPDKWANLTILDRDPFESAPRMLRKLRVVLTIARGKIFRWN